MDVFGVPGLIKKSVKTEDRLAAASHVIDVWVILDPIHTNVVHMQGGRRLKKRVRCREIKKTNQQLTLQKFMLASFVRKSNLRLRLATHSKFSTEVSNARPGMVVPRTVLSAFSGLKNSQLMYRAFEGFPWVLRLIGFADVSGIELWSIPAPRRRSLPCK